MRRLTKKQVLVLAAAGVIGTGNVSAEESIPLEEVVVTAPPTTPPPTITITTPLIAPSDSQVLLSPAQAGAQSAAALKAWKCAVAYSGTGPAGTPAGYAGPKAGWSTSFMNNYGWMSNNIGAVVISPTSTNPASGSFSPVDGFTSNPTDGNPYVLGYSLIFMPNAYAGSDAMGNLINTLAHEWSHQWGATDSDTAPASSNAYAIGNAAENAYKNDKGSKCGGL
jgi:hypothetical protein